LVAEGDAKIAKLDGATIYAPEFFIESHSSLEHPDGLCVASPLNIASTEVTQISSDALTIAVSSV
jgi:hypothetical protein